MEWKCASCGKIARTNRQKCTRCGGTRWKPSIKKDAMELGGPIKRIAPKGLLLAKPGKQAPAQDISVIECGKCEMVIYRTDKGFDEKDFQAAKRLHHSTSPACKD